MKNMKNALHFYLVKRRKQNSHDTSGEDAPPQSSMEQKSEWGEEECSAALGVSGDAHNTQHDLPKRVGSSIISAECGSTGHVSHQHRRLPAPRHNAVGHGRSTQQASPLKPLNKEPKLSTRTEKCKSHGRAAAAHAASVAAAVDSASASLVTTRRIEADKDSNRYTFVCSHEY
ncbi:hypothetical protein CAPTEDRAFT_209032 [Capitella teleta]|uniref:Uncharacterized protein n=1 Tax=Capitella teleta TaxID=283909 RepID=R7UZI2_CAPTE|nr:hypothetical protein CAPTEDRAFT_209032 [Capitella teleta]|eukprot:ELU11684.1 hypothetical protein CAPTEDRAFT_209032 [Capitella teleta]